MLREIYGPVGFNILIVEYRGYGTSGTPSEAALTKDSNQLIDVVLERAEVKPSLILHGRSIGGGVAAQVARARRGKDVAGIIMESTFTSLAPLFPRWFPRFMIRDPFRSRHAISRLVDVPNLLVIHGLRDEIIATSHALALHKAGGEKSRLHMHGGSHNELRPEDVGGYVGALRGFVAELARGSPGAPLNSKL